MESITAIPLDLLRKFCSTDEIRPELHNPIHLGGFAYATDGLIMIRTLSMEPDSEIQNATMREAIPRMFSDFPGDTCNEWTSNLPAGEPKIEPCEICGGTGKTRECESCDGEGEVGLTHSWQDHKGKFHSDDYRAECCRCEGVGRIGGEGETCEECSGTGKYEAQTHVRFADYTYLDACLLKRLVGLPGLQIAPRADRLPLKCVYLRGDGWTGILMPLRASEPTTTESPAE